MIQQPQPADKQNSPTHSLSHRVFANDDAAPNQAIVVDSQGHVGIGTTGPLAKLHVNGGVGSLATGIAFGDGNTGFYENSDNNIWIAVNGTHRWRIENDVFGSSDNDQAVFLRQPSTDTRPSIVPNRNDTDTGIGHAGAYTTDQLSLIAGATEMLRLDQNNDMSFFPTGNVGIGTISPTNILSLSGEAAQIFWMEREVTANTAGNNLTIQSGGATAAATDKAGGDLIIQPGVSTGSGESGVQIKGCVAGASGTADRTQTTAIQVLGNKISVFNQTPVVRQNHIIDADGQLADITTKFNTLLGYLESYGWLKTS